jgi:hypothetical protein
MNDVGGDYDAGTTITKPNGEVLRFSNVSQAQFLKLLSRYIEKFGTRGVPADMQTR